MKFWPFPIVRVYETEQMPNELFKAFVNSDDFKILSSDECRTKVQCELGTLTFWSANKLYAYGKSGEADLLTYKLAWNDGLPSRYWVRAMYNKINSTITKDLKS